jgi:hypothetical protein
MSHELPSEAATALQTARESGPKLHIGGCHCGRVRFQVTIDPSQGSRCNCSICSKISQLGAIVKPETFQLLSGKNDLSEYVWGHNVSRRSFCTHCGVHCFSAGHLAELGGDFMSINLNTLDELDPLDVNVIYWDGRHDNWQAGPSDTPWRIRSEQR